MRSSIKKFSSLVLGAFTSGNIDADQSSSNSYRVDNPFDEVEVGALNFKLPEYLAAHRSHSSHSSHRSSSSSGGGHSSHSSHRSSSSSTPSYSPSTPSKKSSDPLGRPETPKGTYKSKDKEAVNVTKEQLKNIIMRVQFQLQYFGYYDGTIDGIMGPNTRNALNKYRKAKGIPTSEKLDVQTLNSLGIMIR